MQLISEIKRNAPPKATHYGYQNCILVYGLYKGFWQDVDGNALYCAMQPLNF